MLIPQGLWSAQRKSLMSLMSICSSNKHLLNVYSMPGDAKMNEAASALKGLRGVLINPNCLKGGKPYWTGVVTLSCWECVVHTLV